MIEKGSAPKRRKRRWTPWRIFFLASGVLVVSLVLLLTFGGIWFSVQAGNRIEVQMAAIHEAGEPATPAELEEHYRLPPGAVDTTALWLEATALLDPRQFESDAGNLPIVSRSEAEIPPPGQPWDDLEAAEELLAKYRASLELMHQAADAGGTARYPTDFEQGLSMPQGHLRRLRWGAQLLSLETHVRAHRGDPAGSAESIRTIRMIGRSLKAEPTIPSTLVRNFCEGIALWQLQELLGSVDFSDEDLIGLQQDLRAADYEDNLYQAMLGQRVTGATAIKDPAMWSDGAGRGIWRLTHREALAFHLEHMGEIVAATKKPWPRPLRGVNQADRRIDQVDHGSLVSKICHVVPATMAACYSRMFVQTARVRAVNGAADAAIGIERYRRKQGRLPKRLDELVPELLPQVPIDPYDVQPLRYVADEEGCRIYSIGEDQTDDGGEGDFFHAPDVVFRLGAPAEADEAPEQ